MDTRSDENLHTKLPYPYSIEANCIVFLSPDNIPWRVASNFKLHARRHKELENLTVTCSQEQGTLRSFVIAFTHKDTINETDVHHLRSILDNFGKRHNHNYNVAFETEGNIIESDNIVKINMPNDANYTITIFNRWLMENAGRSLKSSPIQVRLEKTAVRDNVTTLIFNNEAERIEGWEKILNYLKDKIKNEKESSSKTRQRKKPKLSHDTVTASTQSTNDLPLTETQPITMDKIWDEFLTTTSTTTCSSLQGFSIFPPTDQSNKRKRENEEDEDAEKYFKKLEDMLGIKRPD